MGGGQKRVPARFYRTAAGREPVREWLLGLSQEQRKQVGTDIATVEFGWPVGMPTCRPMGSGLHEVRTNLDGGSIARVLFCVHERHLFLLHGFLKKSARTAKGDLELARKRMKEILK